MIGAPGSSPAHKSAPSPSPKELWNAYPLDPGGMSPTVEPLPPIEATSTASPSATGDDGELLNFALLLEYVHSAFCAEAIQRARLTGELRGSRRPSASTSKRTSTC